MDTAQVNESRPPGVALIRSSAYDKHTARAVHAQIPQPETASVVIVRPPAGMMPIDRPRVLLVDDNETILKRVTATLGHVYKIVGAVKDGGAALDAVRLLRPDVVVLDISMPGINGLDVARRLCRAGSAVRVVFLTLHNEPELVEVAQAAGGIGYVLKARLSSDLTIAIAEALEGRRYVSRL